jgi:MSHA biogenesis protein MshL
MNTQYKHATRSQAANALALLPALCLATLCCGQAAFSQDTNTTPPPASATFQNTNYDKELQAERATEPEFVGPPNGSKKMYKQMRIAPPHFETWPSPPPPTIVPSPAVSPSPSMPGAVGMPTGTENNQLYEWRADHEDIKAVLAAFSYANHLNIVPDQNVTGQVTLDVHNLSLRQMMNALVEAHDFTWTEDNGLIRVREFETRTFSVDYLRLIRTGQGNNVATLSSGQAGSSGGGGGGGGGSSGGNNTSASGVNLSANNVIDFWNDLTAELNLIMGPTEGSQAVNRAAGQSNAISTTLSSTRTTRTSLAIDKTAGLVQVTARPSVVKQVEEFLARINNNVARQVDVEVKLYDVTLNKQFQFGVDWVQLATVASGSMLGVGGLTGPQAFGGTTLGQNAMAGLTTLGLGPSNGLSSSTGNPVVFSSKNTQVAINALQQQGLVEVISQPRLRIVNNQTALITVGTDTPFFTVTSQTTFSGTGTPTTTTSTTINTLTVGTILSLTPQISGDGWISMDISPVVTTLLGTATSVSQDNTTTAPIVDTKAASTLVRMRDGSTVVLGGLIQTSTTKNDNKIPLLGDIPWLGKLFTGKFDSKVKTELVMFVTPTIVH